MGGARQRGLPAPAGPDQARAYLCEINGVALDAENNAAMPADFLMQQMAWREALDEAADARAVESLTDEVAAARLRRMADLARGSTTTPTTPAPRNRCAR